MPNCLWLQDRDASAERTSAEQLAFSKEKEAPGDVLVGKSILYNWPVVGWCVGQVVERNTDAFMKTIHG